MAMRFTIDDVAEMALFKKWFRRAAAIVVSIAIVGTAIVGFRLMSGGVWAKVGGVLCLGTGFVLLISSIFASYHASHLKASIKLVKIRR